MALMLGVEETATGGHNKSWCASLIVASGIKHDKACIETSGAQERLTKQVPCACKAVLDK